MIRNTRLATLLWCALLAVLLAPNVWLSLVEPLTLWGRLANILLPAGVYMLLMSLMRNPARMVWALFALVFLSAFQLVLLYLYGHSIIAVDMFINLVTTNTAEVGELLGSLMPAMIGVGVVYLPILTVAAIKAGRRQFSVGARVHRLGLRVGIGCALTGSVATAMAYAHPPYAVLDDLYPANVAYNIVLAAQREALSARRAGAVEAFSFGARATHTPDSVPEVYVMVVGETARAANWALTGYGRPTTPHLSATPGVVAFTNAYTQSNTTHKSVPMLLSRATADDFDRLYREKGILAAFGEAGYQTAFLSNQRPNHSFIDLLGQEAGVCRFLRQEAGAGTDPGDADLADALDSMVRERRGPLFVVLHTYGSHFKYHERYPRSMARFTPDVADEAKASNRQALLNAYDNTIVYTDSVLHALTATLERTGARAAMLYASDHGENIFDDSRALFLHASPRPSGWELHVPMVAWTSTAYRRAYPGVQACLEANAADTVLTSASMFHTMLDLAGIATPLRADTLSVASQAYHAPAYRYLTDRNIPVAAERAKLPEAR